MKHVRIAFVLLIAFCVLPCTVSRLIAQNLSSYNVTATVVDENGIPVIGANAQLIQGKTKQGAATDAKGHFRIQRVKAGTYKLELSFIGYLTSVQDLKVEGKNKTINLGKITLKENVRQLEGVTVKAAAADMKVKGDTLEFSAANFGMQEGDVLEDLIKKIPGAIVSESGKITINGKEISKIMIDGQEFFSGDPKMAGKHLPTNMIDKLQVLDRLSDMARMSGFDDGEEETVINIQVKKDMRQGIFGNAYGGLGRGIKNDNNRYETNAIVNQFKGKSQYTIVGGGNNTNNLGFSDLGVDMSQGRFAGVGGRGRGSRGSDVAGAIPNTNPKAGVTKSWIVGANAATNLNDIWDMNGNGRYGYSDQYVETTNAIINFLPNGEMTRQDNLSYDQVYSHNAGTDMRFVWTPDKLTEIIYSPSLRFGKKNRTFSETFENINLKDESMINKGDYGMYETSKNWTTDHRIDFSRHLNTDGRTLSLSAKFDYNSNDADMIYHRNINEDSYLSKQESDFSRLGTRLWASWVEPLGGRFFMQALVNTRYRRQTNNRKNYSEVAKNEWIENDEGGKYTNDFYSFNMGANVKYLLKNMDVTLGFTVDPAMLKSKRYIGDSADYEHQDTTIHSVNFAPTFAFRYRPNKQTSLRIQYRGRSQQPNIDQLMPLPDKTNPLLEVLGNPNLKPSFSHDVFARYQTYFEKYRSSLQAMVFGNITKDAIVSDALYDINTGKRTIKYRNASGNAFIHANASFTMPLFGHNLSMRLASGGAYMRIPGYINGEKNISNTVNMSNRLSFVYQNDWLYTSITETYDLDHFQNSTSDSETANIRHYRTDHEITFNLPWGISIGSTLSWKTTNGYKPGFGNKAWNWDMFASYSFLKNKAATLRFKVYDILNSGISNNNTSTPLTVTHQRTNTVVRYGILHFIFRFNSFSKGAGRGDMREVGNRRWFRGH